MKAVLDWGQELVPWVTLVGLVVHCLRDKREFRKVREK